jgi:hypothetical protein
MITPIETLYKGYRFRSRLEARWAVFFDAMGIQWRYEVQGLDLPEWVGRGPNAFYCDDGSIRSFSFIAAQKYLPDFYLPELDYWIEVKGDVSNDADVFTKPRLLSHHSSSRVFVVSDFPAEQDLRDFEIYDFGFIWSVVGGAIDDPYLWGVCEYCGKAGIGFSGLGERLLIGELQLGWEHACYHGKGKGHDARMHPRLLAAYDTARSARFEHGETPKVPRGKPRL